MVKDIIKKPVELFLSKTIKLSKHSPEILLGCGIAAIVSGTVLACRATIKMEEHLDTIKEDISKVKETASEDAAKQKAIVYGKAAVTVAKDYAPSLLLVGGGILMIVGGHNQLRSRIGALGAAYATLESSYSNYRKRVIEDYGADVDRRYRLGIYNEEVKTTKILKNGKEKEITNVVETVHPDGTEYSMYARYFDAFNSDMHVKDQEMNFDFLLIQQNIANEKFHRQGYLFLNDVYEALGFKKVPEGQLVGWVEGMGDNFIDFGLFEARNAAARDYVNYTGKETCFVLDFNVDGLMWDLI